MYRVPNQQGRRFVITGANSGTGKEAAIRLAEAGGTVVLAVRSLEKGEAAKAEVLRRAPGADVEVRRLDLADLSSVREFADGLLEDPKPVHVLVNNAGVMNPPKRETTEDGFELQLGSNFLGPFLLTTLLLPKLREADRPRVATMTSSAAWTGKIDFGDLQSERRYRPFDAYSQSKLADLVLTSELARLAREHRWALLSTAAHPGYTRTNLLLAGPNRGTNRTGKAWYYKLFPSMDIPEGTDSLLLAATDPGARQGALYGPRFFMVGAARAIRKPRTLRRTDRARVWKAATALTEAPALSATR